jgi:hypothetical protein
MEMGLTSVQSTLCGRGRIIVRLNPAVTNQAGRRSVGYPPSFMATKWVRKPALVRTELPLATCGSPWISVWSRRTRGGVSKGSVSHAAHPLGASPGGVVVLGDLLFRLRVKRGGGFEVVCSTEVG